MPSKAEYRAKLQEVIQRWSAQVDDLRAEAEQLEAGDRGDHEQKIAKLQGRIEKVQAKLDELEAHGEVLWKRLKAEIEAILKSMGEGLEKVSAADETEAVRQRKPED